MAVFASPLEKGTTRKDEFVFRGSTFVVFRYRIPNSVCHSQPWWLSWMRVRLVIKRLRVQPRRVGNILSCRFDHERFSKVILSLPLIQEGQLSVSSETMCAVLINRLADTYVWLGKLTALDMTPLS